MSEEKSVREDRQSQLKNLKRILASMIEEADFECVGVDIGTGKSGSVLRIFIDTRDGVRHEDCERVSRLVADYLDVCEEKGQSWFAEHFFVEVSSPGLERPLFTIDHYRRFKGCLACISLKNRKKLTGVIDAVDDEGNVALALKGVSTLETIPFDEIRKGNLVFVMEKGEKKGDSKKRKK